VHISAKADYAVRGHRAPGLGELRPDQDGGDRRRRRDPRQVPRGDHDQPQGGRGRPQPARAVRWLLAQPPADAITVADVIRAVDGPLASVRGLPPEDVAYTGSAVPLQSVWLAVRSALREVLEHVTLADLATADLPEAVRRRAAEPHVWHTAATCLPPAGRTGVTALLVLH
jgi:hypothetical protein